MNKQSILILIFLMVIKTNLVLAEKVLVSSHLEFTTALASIGEDDTITWRAGYYENIYLKIDKSNLVVMAENAGHVIFTGYSRVYISGSHVTLHGLQFIGGDIGTNDVIKTTGNYNNFLHLNIQNYRSHKYFVIEKQSQYVKVEYCNFENRLNLDDQNIMSVLVDDEIPGYHTIRYCSFKNFDGDGADMGIEPIRIGLSTQGEFISRTIVEYCYFTQCNGDGEIISNKARQNVIHYNTFEDNPKSELVLRHGDESVVYGNFFINGMGGIRVREGKDHVIYNNYFTGLSKRAIILVNDGSDPLDNITIAYNTFVDNEEINLGGTGSYKPTNVTIANNIFSQPRASTFYDPTGEEVWIGNLSSGTLGIPKPDGITKTDPQLMQNTDDFYELLATSPAIDASQPGYPSLPTYPELDIDSEVELDLMSQSRPPEIGLKDIGCSESPHNILVTPRATEANTGPSYLGEIEQAELQIMISGKGKVKLNPPSGIYPLGTLVTLTADPTDDYEFSNWSIDLVSNNNPEEVEMTRNRNVRANFSKVLGLPRENINNGNDRVDFYPNPTKSIVNLTIKKSKNSIVEIVLINPVGREFELYKNQKVQSEKFILSRDVSHFPKGIYFLVTRLKDLQSKVVESQVEKLLIQ